MAPKPGQKTVLITGCTPGGIGHALCLEFHKLGVHVIATARRTSVLTELGELGMSTLPLDVTDKDSIAACHAEVKAITGGRLDILVNNAGRTHTIPATDIDMDDVRATYETNVFGVMAMVAAFADQLVAAKGLLINVCSTSAVSPYVFGAIYCSSKGAVASYSRALRQELRPFGVRVMVVMAGTVRSNIAGAQHHRTLPPNSLYQPVADIFRWRLTFSQTTATVKTEDFARRLATNALASEPPSWLPFLKAWIGRRDWYWDGGLAQAVWFGTTLGEWVMDMVTWRLFKLAKLQKIVEEQDRAKAKTT